MSLTKSALALLASIASATDATGNGWVVLKAPATVGLLSPADGVALIEVNEAMTNDQKEVAARVTDAGRAALAGPATAETGVADAGKEVAPAAPKAVKKTFAIESDIPLVEKTRQPPAEQYPFDALQVGQSFFVADSDVKSGNAYKTLNSTVNTANDRYSKETGETRPHLRNPARQVAVKIAERKFELRHFVNTDEEGNEVKGARVYRVALDV